MKIKDLIKTYGFWTSLAGALVILVNSICGIFGYKIEEKLISDIVLAVAGVLVVFGVVSVPKELYQQNDGNTIDKETSKDDKE